MRQNLPVTQKEHDFPADATLMSTTDTRSRITYANAAFIAASGFTLDELLGQTHNIVRHPDMPPAAFEDMWRTLKQGDSWTALVKNRRSDGDHYWVRANVTPVRRNGQATGYMSVRTKPGRLEVETAEQLYRRMREGSLRGRRLHKGVLVRTGPAALLSMLKTMSVNSRLVAGAMLASVPPAAVGVLAGSGTTPIVAGVVAGLAGTALAALWLHRQVGAPLHAILRQAKSVAAGQADEPTHLDRCDEIGLLMRAVNQAGLNVRALIDDVSEQIGGISSSSTQIATGNADLSARTEQTSSHLQETAASMEELNSTVFSNAQSAREAALLASSASEVAAKGGSVMHQVVSTMQEIRDSSKRIGDITAVIDSLSFQTNILALNAAVEAARAGEAGRGFAVVASEVRTLAQRSADAAREIRSLISASVEKVESGSHLVDEAGHTIQDIVSQVRQVSTLIGDISTASAEQTSGIAQVGEAVSDLDRMTQQNSALCEQSAGASGDLVQRTERLAEAVRVYRSR